MKQGAKTHFHWSIEPQDLCPFCEGSTVLIVAPVCWSIDTEDISDDDEEYHVEVNEEVTGHYCKKCRKLTAMALNT